ncbi:type II CAAX endopeptidase family protein [Bacillus sp. FSL W7-1360]
MSFTFISIFILATTMLSISFVWQPLDFWLLLPLTLTLLATIALSSSHIPMRRRPTLIHVTVASLTAILLYICFAIGKLLIITTGIPLLDALERLYSTVRPTENWHFSLLFILIIPAEELFWRGYVINKFPHQWSVASKVVIAAALYAIAHLASGNVLLSTAAFVCGIGWGWLFIHTKSIWPPIISHLLFNILLLVLFPLI